MSLTLSALNIIFILTKAYGIKIIAILQMMKLRFRDKVSCSGSYSYEMAEPGIGLGPV